MPRVLSANTESINLKIPPAWLDKADALYRGGIFPAIDTRSAMLRAALGYGLDMLLRESEKHKARQLRARRSRRRAA